MKLKSYFDTLKFDPALERLAIAKYLTNFRFVLLLIIAIMTAGLFSFANLPRRLNPQVEIPIVSVATVLPGASPQDIEELLTIPIEDAISGLEGLSKITSNSQENISIVSAEFASGTNPQTARDDVASVVNTVDLPEESQTPNVQKLDFENQPVWQFLVSTSQDTASLGQFSRILKDKIEKVSTVKSVRITGIEQQEIQILIKSNFQKTFGIDLQTLSRSIQSSIKTIPAGNLKTEKSTFSLTVDPTINSVDDIRNLSVNVGTGIIRLGQVATIVERSQPEDAKTYQATQNRMPQRAVSFAVFKTDAANIDKTVADIKKVTSEQEKLYENRFEIISTLDFSELINEQFSELRASFITTILLVIIVLLFFLGIRQALIVAFTIPLSFLAAFTVMNLTGISLNFLSLFSLILALGLLVDDAIVVVTATTAYWRTKKFTANQAGLLVLRDFFVPIWSTTITAVWAFLPILIATGIIGEFIKSIPIVVSTTLIASTAIAILITLPLMMVSLNPQLPKRVQIFLSLLLSIIILGIIAQTTRNNPLLPINLISTVLILLLIFKLHREFTRDLTKLASKFISVQNVKNSVKKIASRGLIDSQKYVNKYQLIIDKVLSSKKIATYVLVMVIIFALFSYALVPLGFVKNEFFPKTDENIVYVSVELPTGTNLDTSEEEALNILGSLRLIQEVNYVTAETSRTISTEDFLGPTSRQNNILFTLVLPKDNQRKQTSTDIAQAIRQKYKSYNKGKFSVIEQTGGPPAGADLQMKLKGEDLTILDTYANQIVNHLKNEPGITNVQKSITSGTSRIVFVPDLQKLANYNLTQDIIAGQLRIFASGFEIEKNVKLNGEKQNIVFRSSSQIPKPQDLTTITVQSPQGPVPLSLLGEFVLKPNPTQITREDQQRTLSVSAATTEAGQVQTQNKKLEEFVETIDLKSGYTWETGGVNEENQKSVNSIIQAMAIAAILIASTMVLQFGSYRKALIVMLLIPLAVSGVFIVFAISQTPLSFPTLIGILALFGIVVYQSMILVDKIDRNIRSKMNLKHAISDAGASRVEPILFGTITTVVGLIPITISDPLWRGLGGAIIAGLLFSGVIMLLFIPVVYYKVFEKEIR